MAEIQKDVFKILDDLEKHALGISDDPSLKKVTQTGFIVSFLPTGLAIYPDDYANPWSPGITEEDQNVTSKRQESLFNLCQLVDSKLLLDGSGRAVPGGTSISETWRVIVDGANALPSAMVVAPDVQKAIDEANKLLFVIDADGNIAEKSRAYEKYEEYFNKYNDAVDKVSSEYLAAREDKIKFQQWPIRGKRFKDEAYKVLDEWNTIGKRVPVEHAIDFLSAQGVDVSAKLISMSKKKFEDNKLLLLNNECYYVRVRPSNWYEPEALDGWSEYKFSSSKQTDTESSSTKKWSGKSGFWVFKGSANGSKETATITSNTESVAISFSYALIKIDRPFMTTLLPNLDGWFLKGGKKGCISNGTVNQQLPGDDTSWLPAIPTALIAIKDVKISSDEIKKNIDEIKNSLTTRVGGGWSFISLKGDYSKSDASKKTGVEITNEGLTIHGTQIVGWLQEIMKESPKTGDPSLPNS